MLHRFFILSTQLTRGVLFLFLQSCLVITTFLFAEVNAPLHCHFLDEVKSCLLRACAGRCATINRKVAQL